MSPAAALRSVPPAIVEPVTDQLNELNVPYAGTVAKAVVFVIGFVVIYFIAKSTVGPLFKRALNARGIDEHAKKPLVKIMSFFVFFASVSAAFSLAGFGSLVQALATIGAAATLAIGLALQDVIKNFVAGIFIFTDKPFRIGDWIEWGDNSGVVEDISMRVTRVSTFNNELLTVPNGKLMSDVIKNPVAKDKLRVKYVFGISYHDNIDQATEIIVSEAEKHEGILEDPEPSVRLIELGDSSVGLQSRVWISNPSRSDFVKTRGEYVQAVKQRFDEEDITIPFPNRTIGGGLEFGNVDNLVEAADD